MDPFTQAVAGATASQTCSSKNKIIIATIIGALAGLSPDLDIFIRSDINPLLFLEYHRHFTHSLLFVPIGSLICSFVFYYTFAQRFSLSFKETYLYSFMGYVTHGIIDSFTSYGTLLYWPFSNERVALNLVSVIDPLFTIPIFIFVIYGVIKRSKVFSMCAILWVFTYQATAYLQKDRAENLIYEYALKNGHDVEKILAKPSFANIVVWKVIYSTSDKYYVNAIRLGKSHKLYPGESIDKLDIKKNFPWLKQSSQQSKDLDKFEWFSNGYLGTDKKNTNIIYDVRFSSIPNHVEGLWGIKLNENNSEEKHVEYITNRKRNYDRFKILFDMVFDNYEY